MKTILQVERETSIHLQHGDSLDRQSAGYGNGRLAENWAVASAGYGNGAAVSRREDGLLWQVSHERLTITAPSCLNR